MTQRERDRLVALNKADKKLITQKQAAQQIGLSERHVRRLLAKLRSQGDRAVIHAARGRASNRKISAKVEKRAAAILSKPLYADFGPTLAAEYLQQRHGIHVGRETLRGWMAAAGLWKTRRRKPGRAHLWRPAAALPRRAGAMGHLRARLAGRTRREAVPDRHDRRCQQRVAGALRAARFQRREPPFAEDVSGEKTAGPRPSTPTAPACLSTRPKTARARTPRPCLPLKSGGRSRSWASNRSGPIRRKPKDASSAALARPRTGW